MLSQKGFEIIIEDDDTNTFFQFEKKVLKMKGSLRNLDDGKTYPLKTKITTIGRENCDINILGVQVESKHAVIEYDEKQDCFIIKDLNTPHGTYVNDCRVQNALVRLARGDIIRLGHGGPRFDILFDVHPNPPVITQEAWDGGLLSRSANLPYLPFNSSSSNNIKPYSTTSYGRHNGYHGHNKTTETQSSAFMPYPPSRARPVSANPVNGVFLNSTTTTRPATSGGYGKDFLTKSTAEKTSDQVFELETHLLKMGDELSRLASFETECYRKDSIIVTLRNEIDQLQKSMGDHNNSLSDEHVRRMALLQSQITFKDEEIKRLQDENRRMKNQQIDYSSKSTQQIADMKTHLARHDHNISTMDNTIKKVNHEKNQLTMLVNTLQKEVTAKDSLLRKSRKDVEKHRVEIRNKDLELSSLAGKVASDVELKKAEKEILKRDEEIGNLRYRLRVSEDKLKQKLSVFQELEDSLSMSNSTITETTLSNKSLIDELQNERSRCGQLERQERSLQIEFQSLKRKYDKFHQNVAEFLGKEGKQVSTVLDDTDVLNYIYELKEQRDSAQNRLEDVLMEKSEVEKNVLDADAAINLQELVANIERNLMQNGRSCTNITFALNLLRDSDVHGNLTWMKDFLVSLLTDEYRWEENIEDALKSMLEQSENKYIDPALLIKQLHKKLKLNLEKINDLELRIHSVESEHSKAYNEIKEKLKEKYKKKTEKALKELKTTEEIKQDNEIKRMLSEEREKLSKALRAQKDIYENEVGSVSILSKKIESLKFEHRRARDEFQKLQRELDEARSAEASLREKLREKDVESQFKEEILEKKYRAKDSEEVQLYKEKAREQMFAISSLEKSLLDMNKEKKEIEYRLMDAQQMLKDSKKETKKQKKEEEHEVFRMKREIEELNDLNKTLKSEVGGVLKERDEHKKISQSLKNDLEGVSAKLTDMKAEMHDEEKQKIEKQEEKMKKQEKELQEQRKQMLQLSTLVDEQKNKIIEQDKRLVKQNDTLAYQADGLRVVHNSMEGNEAEDKNVKFEGLPVVEMTRIGEQCLSKRHEQVIAKQRSALHDLRLSLAKLEHLQPPIPSHDLALQKISSIKKENMVLKAQLADREYFLTKPNEELYQQLCHTKELLDSVTNDYQLEKKAHHNTQEALHASEDMYLRVMRTISAEVEVKHVLGCKPIGYVDEEERDAILKDRAKALEILLKRIKALHSRLERKDHLLESYDQDLKTLRDTENNALQKNGEMKTLEVELSQHKDEVSYLREALKRCRTELDTQVRKNEAFKQKKVFLMDYKEDTSPKQHNCYVDERTKFKEEQKLKKKDELLKKRKYEVDSLKNELFKTDLELRNANNKLEALQISKERMSRDFPDREDFEETSYLDEDEKISFVS